MEDRIRSLAGAIDDRLVAGATVALAWAVAWLTVRTLGGTNGAAAAAYGLPVALAAHRFGWHVGATVAVASAVFAGPLSPAIGTPVTDAETITFAVVFVLAAGLAARVRPAPATPTEPAETPRDDFGTVARELRTPVQAINASVAMLDRLLPRDGDERVALGTLGRANERLGELEQLLSAVGRELTSERREDDQTLVDLRLVAGDVAAELRRQGGLERLRFDAAHDADVVMGHQERIHLLLRCLVGDALEFGAADQSVDCSIRRDVDTLVMRICAVSEGSVGVGGRIRLTAASKLTDQLGGRFEAIDAGGSTQVTVRLPQRRDTDPAPRDARRPAAVPAAGVWTSGASGPGRGVWARVTG